MARYRVAALVILSVTNLAAPAAASAAQTALATPGCASQGISPYVDLSSIDQDLKAVVDFETAVNRYAMMHRQLEGPIETPRVSQDMRIVREAADALARAIQTARKDAQRGDILTPQVTRVFQKRIAACLKPEEWAEILSEHEQADPLTGAPLQVNGRWPVSMPFNYVPPQLLAVLPPLPVELQYRIIGRSLVLWDYHADVIVDFMPSAFTS